MEKMVQKRYALVYSSIKSDYVTVIDFNDENGKYSSNTDLMYKKGDTIKKNRHTLAEIDMFTNSFDSYEKFYNLVLSPSFMENPESVYVLYKHNGFHDVRVHFGNKELKEKASMVKSSKINDYAEINEMVKMLLSTKSKFFEFLCANLDSYRINNEDSLRFIRRIKDKIEYRDASSFMDSLDIHNDKNILRERLSDYKLYREVFLAKQSYLKLLEEKNGIKEFEGFTENENGQIEITGMKEKPKQKVKSPKTS